MSSQPQDYHYQSDTEDERLSDAESGKKSGNEPVATQLSPGSVPRRKMARQKQPMRRKGLQDNNEVLSQNKSGSIVEGATNTISSMADTALDNGALSHG